MNEKNVLIFEPIMVDRVWGGNRLGELFGKSVPEGHTIGESWELSDRPEAQSVVRSGAHKGGTIGPILKDDPMGFLGKDLAARKPDRYPLLVKYVDAGQPLSVQVHPDDDGARRLGLRDRGKCECWYIVHAEPGSQLVRGLKPGVSRADFEAALKADRIEDVLHRFEPHRGDMVAIPPGMVHAIGAGIVIAEIQQNSDLTFRVYDYGRAGLDGKPRPLHIKESLESIRFDGGYDYFFRQDMAPDLVQGVVMDFGGGVQETRLLDGRYFDLRTLRLEPKAAAEGLGAQAGSQVVMVIQGAGRLGDRQVKAGDTALLPANLATADARLENLSAGVMTCVVGTPTAEA